LRFGAAFCFVIGFGWKEAGRRVAQNSETQGPGAKLSAPWEREELEMELTQRQMGVVERLVGAGFQPMAIPPYERALCMRKGECVAMLGPVPNGGLQLLVPVTFLIEGNLSVKLKRGESEVFVWKGKELEATEERLRRLDEFRKELVGILELSGAQSERGE